MTAPTPQQPLISVIMASYNHGRYIRQALQSVVDQERPFPVELVVSDDGSTDDSLSIIAEFAGKYPELVRVVSPEEHLGLGGNFRHAYMQCKGKYVAMLDSDDYWLSRDKLVRQVAVLENDPECTLCFHNAVLWVEWNQTSRMRLAEAVPEFRGGAEFLRRNPVTTMTAMFRNIVDQRILDTLSGLDLQDLPLWVFLADKGTVKFLPDLFGFYRIHGKGTYAQADNTKRIQSRYECLRRIRNYVVPQTQRAMDRDFAQSLLVLAMRKLLQHRDWAAALADWREARRSAARGELGILKFSSLMAAAAGGGLYLALAKLFSRVRTARA
jgi:glycosyltransferase involved in cell wall biosynthesis